MTLAARFREQHQTGRLLLPNAWDAASARIFEEAGFGAIATTSAGIAYTQGFQDAEQIGREAMVRAIAAIVGAVSCPVSADIEGGYGPGPADVAETVDAVLDAGAVGINLEDSVHGVNRKSEGPLLDVDEQCERIAAARAVADRRSVPMVINARTDTFVSRVGRDAGERVAITVERGSRYLQAGADLVFVPLLIDVSLITLIATQLPGPLSLMAMPGTPSSATLFAAGARRVSLGQTAMLATLGSLKQIADELRQHGTWRSIEQTFYGFGEAEALFSAVAD